MFASFSFLFFNVLDHEHCAWVFFVWFCPGNPDVIHKAVVLDVSNVFKNVEHYFRSVVNIKSPPIRRRENDLYLIRRLDLIDLLLFEVVPG